MVLFSAAKVSAVGLTLGLSLAEPAKGCSSICSSSSSPKGA